MKSSEWSFVVFGGLHYSWSMVEVSVNTGNEWLLILKVGVFFLVLGS